MFTSGSYAKLIPIALWFLLLPGLHSQERATRSLNERLMVTWSELQVLTFEIDPLSGRLYTGIRVDGRDWTIELSRLGWGLHSSGIRNRDSMVRPTLIPFTFAHQPSWHSPVMK